MLDDRLLFEKSVVGRTGIRPPVPDVPLVKPSDLLPATLIREDIEGFPELSEIDLSRHYTALSSLNFGIDTGMYPLGSCTMKYNPKVNEDIASLKGFTAIHPYMPDSLVQGALKVICELEELLKEITGMDAVSVHPSAGAQGELCGMLMLASYFKDRGEDKRKKIIIPDTAHGTNPASSALAGFSVVPVKTDKSGILSAEAIREVMDEETAALMLTNPNTLGLFETNIKEIADIVHEKGGLIYCDGANLNAIMGLAKLGDMGVDIVQLNLHKTFSTPHGGGGPGSGPIGVTAELEPYLPVPRVIKNENGTLSLTTDRPNSIGRLRAFYGQFLVLVKAYSYIRRLGGEGLTKVSETAILNANYLKEGLRGTFDIPFDRACMHECVVTDKLQLEESGVSTMDIAKRLIDYGFHPPTIYFPLVVSGAMMIEPTETESLQSIDELVRVMKLVSKEAKEDPQTVKSAPHRAPRKRIDETAAARNPVLRWREEA